MPTTIDVWVAILVVGVGAIFALHHRRNALARALNEPPILPYLIPFVGHALWYRTRSIEVYNTARIFSPDARPVSLTLVGQRIYIVTASKDVSAVYRAKSLSFSPLVLYGLGAVFDISKESRDRISYEHSGPHSSLLDSVHPFYRGTLKEGPSLNDLITSFLECLRIELVKEDAKISASPGGMKVPLRDWARTVLGTASTVVMMGPQILEEEPNLLEYNWQFTTDFFTFVIGLPRFLMRKENANRDRLLRVFERVYRDSETKQKDAIWWVATVQRMLTEAGVTSARDIAAGTFSIWNALQANSNPVSFWLLLQIATIPGLADRIRKSITAAFDSNGKVIDVELLVNDPLLRSTFNETLRIFSCSMSTRLVMEDTIISDYTFRKGAVVKCPIRPHHWDPEIWGPDVEEFVPDRFIRDPGNGLLKGDAKLVRPFGGGASLCPGRFFASYEVLSFVGALLFKYDIKLAEGAKIPQPNLNVPTLGISSPINDVEVVISKRLE
ncbi:cytochrome P450 [Armillaria novae-zelandiae]|uniref:Cytochrome P450 n=1 Tax=Armillaria novae-zelandiae TaxID=153914 RepID=A0AA39PL16_9AGAR|nr:cytochrome P450 [Armillaria novae-zelandiae]